MPKLNKRVARGLKNLPSSFHAGEFAYLCLTSKSEAHLRDHLAFALQRQLSELKGFRKFLVSREWHRHDIAILTGGRKPPRLS